MLVTLSLIAASTTALFGQGRVAFNNIVSGNLITAWGPYPPYGDYLVGSTYSIQLLWAPQGTYATIPEFMAAVLGQSAAFPFIGTTGDAGSAAGYFDGGSVPSPVGTSMPPGNYTMVARAWYNVGFANYDAAVAGGGGIGWSTFFNMTPTVSPTPPPNTIFPSFTIGVRIPEPSTFALAGLGAAALLLMRRRK